MLVYEVSIRLTFISYIGYSYSVERLRTTPQYDFPLRIPIEHLPSPCPWAAQDGPEMPWCCFGREADELRPMFESFEA
jgi:hypothetical protein